MSYRDELPPVQRTLDLDDGEHAVDYGDLGRCAYRTVDADGMVHECFLRARHRCRHVLLSMGYLARPVETVRVRGGVV